jgi:hypothetical protein
LAETVIQRHLDPESAFEDQADGLPVAIQHEIAAGRQPSQGLLEAQLEATERLRTRSEKRFEHVEAVHRLAGCVATF